MPLVLVSLILLHCRRAFSYCIHVCLLLRVFFIDDTFFADSAIAATASCRDAGQLMLSLMLASAAFDIAAADDYYDTPPHADAFTSQPLITLHALFSPLSCRSAQLAFRRH